MRAAERALTDVMTLYCFTCLQASLQPQPLKRLNHVQIHLQVQFPLATVAYSEVRCINYFSDLNLEN